MNTTRCLLSHPHSFSHIILSILYLLQIPPFPSTPSPFILPLFMISSLLSDHSPCCLVSHPHSFSHYYFIHTLSSSNSSLPFYSISLHSSSFHDFFPSYPDHSPFFFKFLIIHPHDHSPFLPICRNSCRVEITMMLKIWSRSWSPTNVTLDVCTASIHAHCPL